MLVCFVRLLAVLAFSLAESAAAEVSIQLIEVTRLKFVFLVNTGKN